MTEAEHTRLIREFIEEGTSDDLALVDLWLFHILQQSELTADDVSSMIQYELDGRL